MCSTEYMRYTILPKTIPGRWSAVLAAVFVAAFLFFNALSRLTKIDLGAAGSFFGILFGLVGTGSLVAGVLSIVKHRERSLLVFVVLPVGCGRSSWLLSWCGWPFSAARFSTCTSKSRARGTLKDAETG